MDTGILSLRFLWPSLADTLGRMDVALQVILKTTYPSYAYQWSGQDETPATTLWELWDAPKEGDGMNSRNHIMDGCVDAFLQEHLGGVRSASFAMEHASPSNKMLYAGYAHRVLLDASAISFDTPIRAASSVRQLNGKEVHLK